MKIVVIADSLHSMATKLLTDSGLQVVDTSANKSELIPALRSANAVIVRSATKITENILEQAHVGARVFACRAEGRAGLQTVDKVGRLSPVAPTPGGLWKGSGDPRFLSSLIDLYICRYLFKQQRWGVGFHPTVSEVDLGVKIPGVMRDVPAF